MSHLSSPRRIFLFLILVYHIISAVVDWFWNNGIFCLVKINIDINMSVDINDEWLVFYFSTIECNVNMFYDLETLFHFKIELWVCWISCGKTVCVSSGDCEWMWVARFGDQSPAFGSCPFLLIVVSRMELELSVFHKVLLMS